MEADWTVALGAGDPVVEVPWTASGECRFIDLRADARSVDEIAEAGRRPALRAALLQLNSPASAYWTAKCDVWTSSVAEDPMDRYEMDADAADIGFGSGSYVDVLCRDPDRFAGFDRQEQWMRAVTTELRSMPVRAVRVELVLRAAEVQADAGLAMSGFAISWFVEACGATKDLAAQRWELALGLSLKVILGFAGG